MTKRDDPEANEDAEGEPEETLEDHIASYLDQCSDADRARYDYWNSGDHR